MSTIKLALVGCGGMAQSHISRLEAVRDRIEISAVADLNEDRAKAVAALLPDNPVICTDHLEAMGTADAGLLVLPHHLHAEVAIDWLNAGKHVLAEKPMANSEAECRAMIAAAKANKRILMIGYCMRYHPLVARIKELLDQETFGPVYQIAIWTEQLTILDNNHWGRRANQLGGGQFFSHGCHYIDLLLWMLGKPLRGAHFGTNRCTPWMEAEGTSNVVLEFESGALGYHYGSWGARGSRLKWSLHAHCERGMLEIRLQDGKLIAHVDAGVHVPGLIDDGGREEILMESPRTKATAIQLAHFLDCIKYGNVPHTDGVSSLEGLRVIWELYAAENEHRLANLRGLGLGTEKQSVCSQMR